MVPTLISLLKDETPAVARQAIATGTILFQLVLEKVVVDKLDDSLKSCWKWMLNFKDLVLPVAIQSGNDGVRLLAVKFVEALVLLYTPDPKGDLQGFNISWVRRGHPFLNVADLSMEASQSLSLLLDQLRFPNMISLSNSMITVLTDCLSAIALRRPSFYGRIVPVLLGLYPASWVVQGVQVQGARHAMKNALLACWKCTHPSAEPWRPRLIETLKAMDAAAEVQPDVGCKRRFVEDNNDVISHKRIRSSQEPLQTVSCSTQNNLCLIGSFASMGDGSSVSIQQLVDAIGALVSQDEQKDRQLKAAFVRILEAYKQVAVSDGSDIHFSLLANLGIDFPSELDSWGLLQKHVMCNYVNHKGHELILRVLYRLYQKIEQDKYLLSSRVAASVYESFLLAVAEALRNTFPASDKSLGKLLVEVPYLSEGVLKLVECLCSPEENGKDGNSFRNGDRVTQGLSIVWNLILLRPSNRDRCLQIALEGAVHHREEVRTKAIRLLVNKLFPVASISKKIEDFANEKLHSAINITQMDLDDDESIPGSESSFSKAQRCMALYFALCTKKHSLLLQIFAIYQTLPKGSKEAVHSLVPVLVRTIGSSDKLFDIIATPPVGSEDLLIQVLQILTDAAAPSQNLILSIKRLCESRPKDVHVLIPVAQFLSKDEVISIFPQFVNLPLNKFQAALTRILQGTIQTGSSLTPAEVLIAIHDIDSQRDRVPLKKVIDACSACFEQQSVFTEQVLAKVLNKLVEQIPLPLLFMRTVIQAIALYPALVDFVMEILSKLVRKQIWKFPKLWVGFLKCVLQTMPQSFGVLLKLPFEQLENALNQNPVLRAPLVEHANLPNIRSSLPQSTLLVLGLVNDPHASSGQSQAQSSHSQDADTGSFAADIAMEKALETMAVS